MGSRKADRASHAPPAAAARSVGWTPARREAVTPSGMARVLARRVGDQRTRRIMGAADGGAPHRGQAKLAINTPGDLYEREADRGADAVMSGAPATVAARGGASLRRCACGGTCAACRGEEEPLRRKDDGADGPAGLAPPIVHHVLASAGRPLAAPSRVLMERRFGADFSAVRVHDDARAAESARVVGAHAYAVGSDIVFGAGRYAPGTPAGDRLLAHELAHTLQAVGARTLNASLEVGAADDPAEREADRAAGTVLAGMRPSPPALTDGCTLRRAVHWTETSVTPVVNVAERTVEAALGSYVGVTWPVLNGVRLIEGGRRAAPALHRPAFRCRNLTFGTTSCTLLWAHDQLTRADTLVPAPIGSAGAWHTRAERAALVPRSTFLSHCPRAGTCHLRAVGVPTSEAFRERVMAHERAHAADWRRAFLSVLEPWDRQMAAAAGREAVGGFELDAQDRLMAQAGGTPDEVGERLERAFTAASRALHGTPLGRGSAVAGWSAGPGCEEITAQVDDDRPLDMRLPAMPRVRLPELSHPPALTP